MNDENHRREFLKGAAVAALGSATVAALGSTAATAQEMQKMGQPGRPMAPGGGRRLTVFAKPGVNVDELTAAIRAGLNETPCRACGLLGVDIWIEVSDPPAAIDVLSRRLPTQGEHIGGIILGGGGP